jgi:hypothetical protein
MTYDSEALKVLVEAVKTPDSTAPSSQSRRVRQYTAPPGQIWVCRACGKRARNRAGRDNPLWDESCAVNAVLCYDDDPLRAVSSELEPMRPG